MDAVRGRGGFRVLLRFRTEHPGSLTCMDIHCTDTRLQTGFAQAAQPPDGFVDTVDTYLRSAQPVRTHAHTCTHACTHARMGEQEDETVQGSECGLGFGSSQHLERLTASPLAERVTVRACVCTDACVHVRTRVQKTRVTVPACMSGGCVPCTLMYDCRYMSM